MIPVPNPLRRDKSPLCIPARGRLFSIFAGTRPQVEATFKRTTNIFVDSTNVFV
jgi:hypothetical protein